MLNGGAGLVNSRLSRWDSRFFRELAHPCRRAPGRARGGAGRAYAPIVMGRLQDRRGHPRARTQALAALVIIGLVVLTAPVVVLPVVEWLARFL